MKIMVKFVLFDFWGTLVENGVKSPIKQVRDSLELRLPFSEFVVRMERAMMTGSFESLKEAFESVGREFKIRISEEQMEELIGIWNKSWMLAKPYPEVEKVLNHLRKDYRLILISNTDNISMPNVIKKYKLDKFFEKQFLSFEMGMIKTDINFLKTVLKDVGAEADDCILVGDSLESDIAAGQQAGIKSILLDRKSARDFYPKINNLKDLTEYL